MRNIHYNGRDVYDPRGVCDGVQRTSTETIIREKTHVDDRLGSPSSECPGLVPNKQKFDKRSSSITFTNLPNTTRTIVGARARIVSAVCRVLYERGYSNRQCFTRRRRPVRIFSLVFTFVSHVYKYHFVSDLSRSARYRFYSVAFVFEKLSAYLTEVNE